MSKNSTAVNALVVFDGHLSGTVHGDEMELTMPFYYRGHESDSVQSEFKGKRVK